MLQYNTLRHRCAQGQLPCSKSTVLGQVAPCRALHRGKVGNWGRRGEVKGHMEAGDGGYGGGGKGGCRPGVGVLGGSSSVPKAPLLH